MTFFSGFQPLSISFPILKPISLAKLHPQSSEKYRHPSPSATGTCQRPRSQYPLQAEPTTGFCWDHLKFAGMVFVLLAELAEKQPQGADAMLMRRAPNGGQQLAERGHRFSRSGNYCGFSGIENGNFPYGKTFSLSIALFLADDHRLIP